MNKAKQILRALFCTTFLGLTGIANAADDYTYSYVFSFGTHGVTSLYEGGFNVPTAPGAPVEMQGKTFKELTESNRTWGHGHAAPVFAFDWMAYSEVLYSAASSDEVWGFFANGNMVNRSSSPGSTILTGGLFDGQSILGNPYVAGLHVRGALLYDSTAASGAEAFLYYDDTLSFDSYLGFDTFVGGAFDGLTLLSQVDRMIGVDGGFFFIEDDGSLIIYGTDGSLMDDPTWTTLSGGPLDGMTLVDALTGGGYIGLGTGQLVFAASMIPEPSSWLLMGVGAFGIAGRIWQRRTSMPSA